MELTLGLKVVVFTAVVLVVYLFFWLYKKSFDSSHNETVKKETVKIMKYNPYQDLDKIIQEIGDNFKTNSSDPNQLSISCGTTYILIQVAGLDWEELKYFFSNHYVLGYVYMFTFGIVSELGINNEHEKTNLVNKIYNNIFEYLFNDDHPNPIREKNLLNLLEWHCLF